MANPYKVTKEYALGDLWRLKDDCPCATCKQLMKLVFAKHKQSGWSGFRARCHAKSDAKHPWIKAPDRSEDCEFYQKKK